MHFARNRCFRSATGSLAVALVCLHLASQAWGQSSGVGNVSGTVVTDKGKPVGGFWLMIVNPELGINYRKDVNPIGKFLFTDVYPGTYVFRISPYSYTVLSPAQIQVKAGQVLDVKVIVATAPRSTGQFRRLMPGVRIMTVAQSSSAAQAEQATPRRPASPRAPASANGRAGGGIHGRADK